MRRAAIPVFESRVAPNFLYAHSLLVVQVANEDVISRKTLSTQDMTELERIKQIEDLHITTLICGGIEAETVEEFLARGIDVINNVAGEIDDVLIALEKGSLKSGFGIVHQSPTKSKKHGRHVVSHPQSPSSSPFKKSGKSPVVPDCITCKNRVCLEEKMCSRCGEEAVVETVNKSTKHNIEIMSDIAAEPERILCRVAELVYYCLGMEYTHLGVAFCTELFSEAETITQLLRKFFKVTAVCCKVGGIINKDFDPLGTHPVMCNPLGMANLLNKARPDLNVMIGLCMGADIIFMQLSFAPVTTLFVKDRLLANNPIGVVYSKYQQEQLLEKL